MGKLYCMHEHMGILAKRNYKKKWKGNAISKKYSDSEVAQLCPTLCSPMDCNLLGSSVNGIFQARVLEWVAISFSKGSSQPRDWTRVSCIVGRYFIIWATREVKNIATDENSFNKFIGRFKTTKERSEL